MILLSCALVYHMYINKKKTSSHLQDNSLWPYLPYLPDLVASVYFVLCSYHVKNEKKKERMNRYSNLQC